MSRHPSHTAVAALILLIVSAASPVSALSPPHNTNNAVWSITCSRCHYVPSGSTPTWATLPTTTDDTLTNNLCTSCHSPSGMPLTDPRYTDVKTHSATLTGSSAWNGNWSVECIVCHNPHYQQQSTTVSADTDHGGNVLTGTVSSIATAVGATMSSLVAAGANLTPNEFVGYLLVPDRSRPSMVYRIRSNTTATFTVDGAINPNYTGPGRSFAVRYGKFVNIAIDLPARRGGNPAVTGASVKFYNSTGPNSFATGSTPAQGICMICHTQTTSFRNDGTLEGAGHPPSAAGTNCMQCHLHASGFKPECGSCHGNPPVTATPGGPSGLANNDGGTGSTTPGAHRKHALSLGYSCTACHSGGMPASAIYDKTVQIGFTIANGAYQTGSFDGRAALTNGYTYSAGNPGTTVTTGGTMVCANVYCHGSTMAPNGGADITPAWTSSATGACGTCHGAAAAATPTRGSHYQHSRTDLLGYAYPCGICHKDPAADASQHVNGQSEVVFSSDPKAAGGSYDGTPAMLDAYGACTNVYCHSTVQSSPPGSSPVYRVTPAWGSELWSCGGCHDYAANLTTGSHGKHMQQPLLQECWACHSYNSSDDECMACHDADTIEPQRDRHANHSIDVTFAPKFGGSYSGTPAPGDSYGSCANTYCHGNYPGSGRHAIASWGSPTSGAHSAHATTQGGYQPMAQNPCALCHAGVVSGPTASPVISDTTKHVSGLVDWAFDAGDARISVISSYSVTAGALPPSDGAVRTYGQCSNVYCHSSVQGANGIGAPASFDTPRWAAWKAPEQTSGTCASQSCHGFGHNSSPPSTGSHGKHLAYLTGLSGFLHPVLCITCHTRDTQAAISCNYCHGAGSTWPTQHANGGIDVDFLALYGGPDATYSGSPQPGDGYGSCSSVYCHGAALSGGTNTTPTWGGSAPCGSCHAATGTTLTSGSHATHLTALKGPNGVENTTVTCDTCHGSGASSGAHAGHVDASVSFADGRPLSSTTVCHTCHSPGGSYDGVNDAVLGAKANWALGVYDGKNLKSGKGLWCAGCHDNVPANSKADGNGVNAVIVTGNNSSYGVHARSL